MLAMRSPVRADIFMKINRNVALKRMALGTAGILAMPYVAPAQGHPAPRVRDASQETDKGEHWRNSALIIVDMQNDFVRVGAPLEVPEARETIRNHQLLIEAFRKRNLPIVYTKFLSYPHYYLLWDWSPQCAPPTKCCWKGHERYYSDIGEKRQCTEVVD